MPSDAELHSTRKVIQFFALAFGLSWAVWIPASPASHKLLPLWIPPVLSSLLGVFGPSVAAVSLAHAGLHVLFGGQAPDFVNPPFRRVFPLPPELAQVSVWVLLAPVFLQQLVLSSPMGEEIGWRGYALPKLQVRVSVLNASLLLGVLWGLWHLPLLFTAGDPRARLSFGWLILGMIPVAILFTWLYNNTRGSLLLALLYHNSFNVTGLFLAGPEGTPYWPLVLNWLLAAVVLWKAGAARLAGRRAEPPPAT